ncbi:MAG: hypothetical protein ABJG15_00585 [Hyphomonadaceae bacterium]
MSMTGTVLRGELEAWCAHYIEAFMAFDAEAIGAAWTYPATVNQAGRIFVFEDQERFVRNTKKLCEFYKRQGVARAERRVVEVLSLGKDTASMLVSDIMYDAAGSALAQWQAGYTLVRIDGDWKAVFAVADGETESWAARGTPLGQS